MWILLLCACVSVISLNNAQERTNFVTQTDSQTSYTNNVPYFDSTKPPVTLTIRSGRTDNNGQTVTNNSDQPLIYSNDWQRIFLPYGFSSHGDSNSNANDNTQSVDNQSGTTFFRRPDSEVNITVPSYYSPLVERNVQVPYAPILYFQRMSNITSQPLISETDQVYSEPFPNERVSTNEGNFQTFDLYRNAQPFVPPVVPLYSTSQSSLNSNVGNLDHKEVSSSTVQKLTNSAPSETKEPTSAPLSTEYHHSEQEILPVSLYRSSDDFLQPVLQGYYPPYSFFPIQRDRTFQRIATVPSNDPNFDRESGPGTYYRNPLVQEKQVLPGGVSDSDHLAENAPSDIPTDTIQSHSLPVPVAGYPFGLYPPQIISPLLPNIPASRFPLNTLRLPQPTLVQREGVIADAPRPLPIVPVRPLQHVFPDIFPATSNLAQEGQIKVQTVQENLEESIPDEDPNSTKIPYEFGFDMNDGKGNDQHRKEISDISGIVTGSYGYRDLTGIFRFVNYIADKDGFRAFIRSNEPGVASSGSANVVVMAERSPPRVTAEEKKENETKNVAVTDTTVDLITPDGIIQSK